MSDTLKIGHIITTEQHRDAVHMAIVPVKVADYVLRPGAHVGVDEQGNATVDAKHIGIIDPFLLDHVHRGKTAWLFLYPGTITSLRHDWTHPAIDTATSNRQLDEAKKKAHLWMKDYVDRLNAEGESYDGPLTVYELLNAAARWISHKECFSKGPLFDCVRTDPEFWTHYATLTGQYCTNDNFFSCSC